MLGRVVVGVLIGLLGLAVIPFGILYQLLTMTFSLRRYFLAVGESLSQLLNASSAELLELTLSKGPSKFGNPDRTVSGVLGELEYQGRLTLVGAFIVMVLDYVDPMHCYDAWQNEI